ncbi:MAG TPA: ROK family protein [Acidobacteriaceae bacterium]|jgi:glucokinase|nr:ROK family protein [Acidobacteriaceae bacterium]
MKIIGAVDIGGTKIAVGGVREDGTIAFHSTCTTDPQRGFDEALQRIREMLRGAANACGKLEGIGIACPGPLDPYSGILGQVGTLPGWEGRSLCDELETEFEVTIAVENDADAAALGEMRWGAAKGNRNFIYITVSTGIGGGIVLQGELYRGVDGSHPELGHQILDSTGPLCYCGVRGCWESLASGSAMTQWMSEQMPESPPASAEMICQLAAKGDGPALRAVRREGLYLGLGLANLVTLFSPGKILLGGGVMKSSALFLDYAREVVLDACTQVPAKRTDIVLASLGADSGLLGAAQAWLNRCGQTSHRHPLVSHGS